MSERTLDYASTNRPEPSVWLSRIAIACAIAPLVLGTLIFVAYLLSHNTVWAGLGLLMLGVGTIGSGISAICVIVELWQGKHSTPEAWRRAKRSALLVVIILVISCMAAGLYAQVGSRMLETFDFVVLNNGTTKIDSFVVSFPSGSNEIGPIAPGRQAKTSFQLGRDGAIGFTMTRAGATTQASVRPYAIAGPIAESIRLVVNDNGVKEQ
jgi:hypothetical protein